MAYRIRKRLNSKGLVYWRLIYEKYKGNVRDQRHIPESEWGPIGFSTSMTVSEAEALAKQLNSVERLKWLESKRNNITEKLNHEKLVESAFLPKDLVSLFESEVLIKRLGWKDIPNNKGWSHWRAVKRLIVSVTIQPSDWDENSDIIYRYFESIHASPSYCQKILRILNLWGHFFCKRTKASFLPVKPAIGHKGGRIADAYREKRPNGMESAPITPEELNKARDRGLTLRHYNWLYIAMWFGLRPSEVDAMHDQMARRIGTIKGTAVPYLSVYQKKLRMLKPQDRWKLIPILEPEQQEALKLILAGEFSRPLTKTIRSLVNPEATTYGPRKGFTELMVTGRGHPFINVSAWLGHQSIDRTWKSYRNKSEVLYKKAI